jgi:hypothetical protein
MTMRVYGFKRAKNGSRVGMSLNPNSQADINNAFIDYLFFYHTRFMFELILAVVGSVFAAIKVTYIYYPVSTPAEDPFFFTVLGVSFVALWVLFGLLRVLFPNAKKSMAERMGMD